MADDIQQSAANGIQPTDNPNPDSLGQPDPSQQNSAPPVPPTAGNTAPTQATQPPAPTPGNTFAASAPPPQTSSNGTTETLGGQAPTQAPSPTPDPVDPDDKAIDSLLAELTAKQPKEVKKQHEEMSEFDRLAGELNNSPDAEPGSGLVTKRLPGESWMQSMMRSWPEDLKAVGAQMRGRIDNNPKNMVTAFQSMFGADNVKTSGDKVMFRPDPNQKFRSVDEHLFGGLTDFILFNALGAVPAVANMGVQAAGQPLAAAAAPFVGSLGEAGVGAAGGTAETLLKQGIQSGLNSVSDLPQERKDLTNEILWNAGLNAAAPIAVRGLIAGGQAAGSYVYNKSPQVARFADDVFKTVTDSGAWAAGTEAVQKLSQIRVGFNEIRNQLFPEAVGKTQAEIGTHILGAVEAEQKSLGKAVGAIKQDALSLAAEKDAKSDMANTREKISETLKKHGYHTDPETGLLQKEEERRAVYRVDPVMSQDALGNEVPTDRVTERSFDFGGQGSGISGFDAGLQQLADFHNRLVGEGIADGGTQLKSIFNDLDNLIDPKSRWGMDAGKALDGIYRGVRGAVGSDRNTLIDTLFQGAPDSTQAETWKSSFDRFSQNANAVSRMKTMFYSPNERNIMVDAFNKASTADKNQFIDDVAHVLGSDSKEFNMFKGGLFENLVNSAVKPNGVIDAEKISRALVDPSNSEYFGKLFDKNQIATVNRMAIEGQNIMTKYEATPKSYGIIEKGFGTLAKLGFDPRQIVKTLFNISGSNKSVLDYMTDKGFFELMERAETPEIRANLMKAKSMTENAISKMQIIDVASPKGAAFSKAVKRYAPVAGPALSRAIDKVTDFGPKPQPVPQAPPQPDPSAGQAPQDATADPNAQPDPNAAPPEGP